MTMELQIEQRPASPENYSERRGTTMKIVTRQGKAIIVDDLDVDLCGLRWWAHKCSSSYYAERREHRYTVKMHRVILGRMLGRRLRSDEYVDHVNANGLDNRRINLRLATPSENCRNRKVHSNNISGIKGVSRYHWGWRARIQANGKQHSLGIWPSAQKAAEVYNQAAQRLHGQFARLNDLGLCDG